jgi:AcrR family transcriptional regulator
MQKRGYHHGRLRRALLDAVIAHAAERGHAGDITLREAARRAGVSHTAPYRHFPHKAALLAAVGAEGFADLSRMLRAARTGVTDAEERFVRTGLAYLRFAHEQPGHLAIMFGPEVAKSETAEFQRAANDAFTALQEMANDAGTKGAHARELGTIVWSFLHGLADLTAHGQVPASVGATPERLAVLGLRHLYRSFTAAAKSRTPPAPGSARGTARRDRRLRADGGRTT